MLLKIHPQPTTTKFVVMVQRGERYHPMIGRYLTVTRIWVASENVSAENTDPNIHCHYGPFNTHEEAEKAANTFNCLWLIRPIEQ